MRYVSAPKSVALDLWSEGRGPMLIAIAFGWFLSISVRMIYPSLLPYLRTAYGLSLTTAGLLLSVLWVAYGLGQLPGGLLADRVGERLLLILSSLIAAGMLTLVVVADSPVVLFVGTSLFGLGTAMYGVSRFTILKDIYPDRLGTATGVTMAAGDIGNAVMPPAAGILAATVAWQYGFSFAVPLFLLAAAGLWLFLPARSAVPSPTDSAFDPGEIVSMLRQRVVVHAAVLLVLWEAILQAFIGFYPTYLIDVEGLSASVATGLFGLFFAFGGLVKLLSGRAYDRIGVRYPLAALMSVTAVGIAAIPFASGLPSFVAITVLASGILGSETVVISDLTGRLSENSRGAKLGSLRTFYIMLGALSPVVFGGAADLGHFDEAFLGVAVLTGGVVLYVLYYIDY
ncbi:MFS transporter [Natronomonas aquatica]